MAFTAYRTWTATELVTAAMMNEQIRANGNALIAAVLVRNSANLPIAADTWTGLTFNTETVDNDGMHSTVSNSSRLTCNTPGLYEFGGTSLFTESAGVAARVMVNDSTVNLVGFAGGGFNVGTDESSANVSGAWMATLSSAQYLTWQVYSIGTTNTVKAHASASPTFWAKWLSAT